MFVSIFNILSKISTFMRDKIFSSTYVKGNAFIRRNWFSCHIAIQEELHSVHSCLVVYRVSCYLFNRMVTNNMVTGLIHRNVTILLCPIVSKLQNTKNCYYKLHSYSVAYSVRFYRRWLCNTISYCYTYRRFDSRVTCENDT